MSVTLNYDVMTSFDSTSDPEPQNPSQITVGGCYCMPVDCIPMHSNTLERSKMNGKSSLRLLSASAMA
jgi:hypothetical protein